MPYSLYITGSESTQRMTKLMNDVFDVLNGRTFVKGINEANKKKKLALLEKMNTILNITEEIYASRKKHSDGVPPVMFMSTTTLRSFRIVLHSAIDLTKEMLGNGYITVLTARWNQDPVEVILKI